MSPLPSWLVNALLTILFMRKGVASLFQGLLWRCQAFLGLACGQGLFFRWQGEGNGSSGGDKGFHPWKKQHFENKTPLETTSPLFTLRTNISAVKNVSVIPGCFQMRYLQQREGNVNAAAQGRGENTPARWLWLCGAEVWWATSKIMESKWSHPKRGVLEC